jgi:competence protein ComFB
MELKNLMEEVVWQELKEVLRQREDICHCQNCQHDIAALALNQLPPKYVATQNGEIYAKVVMLRAQLHADVLTAISKALLTVTQNPRHGS